jgi:DNA-binding MarR family transcriptional regulator/GNAT superfamily N-acetyltransferase
MASPPDLDQEIDAVRRFNRFYTKRIGVLRAGYHGTPFSLTEARVLYELSQRGTLTATEIGRTLELDGGYLSRVMRDFKRAGLIEARPAPEDRRQSLLTLTKKGRAAYAPLEERSKAQAAEMLRPLSSADRRRLAGAMDMIAGLVGTEAEPKIPYLLRPPRIGDFGWMVQRQAEFYAETYGWRDPFEGLVAEIVADVLKTFDPKKIGCWVAERDGENVGSVILARDSDTVAQVRLLFVEPRAQGLGIGKRLVQECTRFARQAGYRKITLWTHSVLTAARHLYEQEGYHLTATKKHRDWGPEVTGETWEKKL